MNTLSDLGNKAYATHTQVSCVCTEGSATGLGSRANTSGANANTDQLTGARKRIKQETLGKI
jgi:hypothetical protein